MKFNLKRPCENCPFRKDIPPYLRPGRAREIAEGLLSGQTFSCHKTVRYDDEDGEACPDNGSEQHCAGALILLERHNRPGQLMRIAERLGMYNRDLLRGGKLVYRTFNEFIEACRHVAPKRVTPTGSHHVTGVQPSTPERVQPMPHCPTMEAS